MGESLGLVLRRGLSLELVGHRSDASKEEYKYGDIATVWLDDNSLDSYELHVVERRQQNS